jgi:hypothetical protein
MTAPNEVLDGRVGVADLLAPLDVGTAVVGREELRDDEDFAPDQVLSFHVRSSW